jgi:PD-(D/E)XK nuclease superfamily
MHCQGQTRGGGALVFRLFSARRKHGAHGEKDLPLAERLIDRIIGLAIEVHRNMGPGLLESVYEQCLRPRREINESIG